MTTLAEQIRAMPVAKELVWEEVQDQIPKHASSAYTGFGRWLIVTEFLSMNHAVFRLHGVDYATLDLAKAAAQADHEARLTAATNDMRGMLADLVEWLEPTTRDIVTGQQLYDDAHVDIRAMEVRMYLDRIAAQICGAK